MSVRWILKPEGGLYHICKRKKEKENLFLPLYFDDNRKELGIFPCSGTWNYQQLSVCLLFGEHKVLWDKFHKSVKIK